MSARQYSPFWTTWNWPYGSLHAIDFLSTHQAPINATSHFSRMYPHLISCVSTPSRQCFHSEVDRFLKFLAFSAKRHGWPFFFIWYINTHTHSTSSLKKSLQSYNCFTSYWSVINGFLSKIYLVTNYHSIGCLSSNCSGSHPVTIAYICFSFKSTDPIKIYFLSLLIFIPITLVGKWLLRLISMTWNKLCFTTLIPCHVLFITTSSLEGSYSTPMVV